MEEQDQTEFNVSDEISKLPEISLHSMCISDETSTGIIIQPDEFEEDTMEFIICLPNGNELHQPMVNTQLVQELVQVLSDRIETCHQTCVSLYEKSTNLKVDNFAELKDISKDLVLQEEMYTSRQARQHILHINELANIQINEDAYDGMLGNSPSAVESLCSGFSSKLKLPKGFHLPGSKDTILLDSLCVNVDQFDPCILEISFGKWNPPPDERRLEGDLLYVRLHTLENKIIHATACENGFYVNQSTDEAFLPRNTTKSQKQIYHSLVDLLQATSSQFKRKWTPILERKFSQNPLLRIPCAIPVFNWFRRNVNPHRPDILRSSMYCHEMGLLNEMVMSSISPIGQLRDWNEEIQLTRTTISQSLNSNTFPAHRAAFRVHCDFVSSAVRTAKAVVDGQIPSVNPSENWNLQMFIWNNLFISMAFDVRDHYKEYGSDLAAHHAAKSDLRGIELLSTKSCNTLCTVGTILADYMGFRVAVQSIVPGILEKEQEQSIIYGSSDFGKSFMFNQEYNDKLLDLGKQLKLKPHTIRTKGLITHDKTCSNIFETGKNNSLTNDSSTNDSSTNDSSTNDSSTNDSSTNDSSTNDSSTNNSSTNDSGFIVDVDATSNESTNKSATEELTIIMPIELKGIIGNDNRSYILDLIRMTPPDLNFLNKDCKIPHKILSLRPELLDHFSSKDDFFVVNSSQPFVDVIDSQDEKLSSFCNLLFTEALPNLLVKYIEEEEPLDGQHLVKLMHKSGINVRYLKHVIEICGSKRNLNYAHGIAAAELICRCAKHVFRQYSHKVFRTNDLKCSYSKFVAHFLNCFMGFNEINTKRGQKQKKLNGVRNNDMLCMTEKSLWNEIQEDAISCYNFEMSKNPCYHLLSETFNLSRVGIIRRFCQMTGIQLCINEDGTLWSNGFTSSNISNANPIIYHIPPPVPSKLTSMLAEAEQLYKDKSLQKCYILTSRTYGALINLYGPIHSMVAQCLRLMAKINFLCNDSTESFVFQQRATLITERLTGLDSCYTAYDYITLSHYCFVSNADTDSQLAVDLMLRARQIACVAFPLCDNLVQSHPIIIRIDANLALMLQSAGAHQLASLYAKSLIERSLNRDCKPLDEAIYYNINARVHSCLGEFKQALANERKSYMIYRTELGEENKRTMQSDGLLKHLTHQAVILERRVRESKSNNEKLPIFVQAPSKTSVVELMNIINGIEVVGTFITASAEGFEILRNILKMKQEKENLNIEALLQLNKA